MSINVDVSEAIKKLLGGAKYLIAILAFVILTCILLLYLPESLLHPMALDKMAESTKTIIGYVLVAASALLIVVVSYCMIMSGSAQRKHNRIIKMYRKRYCALPNDLKLVLKKVLDSPQKSMQLSSQDGNVLYLEGNDFLHKTDIATFFSPGSVMPSTYVPEPWLIDLYIKEPELFQNLQ